MTLPVFMLTGFPVHMIAGTNMASTVAGATASVIRYSKNKKIYWQTALVAGVLSLAGSYFGSKLNIMIPEKYLQYIMIVILPVNCNSIATEVYHFFRLNVPHLS